MSSKTKNMLLKINSRELISGRTHKGVVFLLLRFATAIFSGWVSTLSVTLIESKTVSAVLIFMAALLTFSFVSAFKIGEEAWHCCLSNGKTPSVRHVIFWIMPRRLMKSSVIIFVLIAEKTFWAVLFLTPGIVLFLLDFFFISDLYSGVVVKIGGFVSLSVGFIFTYIINQRYFLAKYLVARFPNMKIRDVLKWSVFAMNGNCIRTVMYKTTFLPLLISVISFPYIKQSCVGLKKEIIESSFLQKQSE